MQPESPKLLEDVRDAAEFILECVADLAFDAYVADRTIRQAIERNFEIIGEAFLRLRRMDPQTAERVGDVRQIIAFRNVLVHGYDSIEHEIVWDVIHLKLPPLLEQVRRLLAHSTEQE